MATAAVLLDDLCREDRCWLSPQVLSEFCANVTRKLPHRLEPAEALAIVVDLAACVRTATMREDALIVTSALRSGAAVLWSEDLQDRARYDGLAVRNPFA
jgi:predicted nucleic acid-binding protein